MTGWGTPADEAVWQEAAEANLGPLTTTPPISLRDLARDAVMAVDLVELGQVVQAAQRRFGDDALDLSCVVPGSCAVIPLGDLIAKCAGRLTE